MNIYLNLIYKAENFYLYKLEIPGNNFIIDAKLK